MLVLDPLPDAAVAVMETTDGGTIGAVRRRRRRTRTATKPTRHQEDDDGLWSASSPSSSSSSSNCTISFLLLLLNFLLLASASAAASVSMAMAAFVTARHRDDRFCGRRHSHRQQQLQQQQQQNHRCVLTAARRGPRPARRWCRRPTGVGLGAGDAPSSSALDGRVETLARWLEEEMAEDGTVSYECDGESADNAGSKQQSARDQAALRWLVRQGAAAAAETQAEVTNVGTEKAQAERSGRLWQEEEEEQIAAPEQQRWTSRWTRVPGCVAAVRLRTTIRAGAAPVLAEDAAEGLDASAGAAKPSDHDDDDGGDNDVVSVSASSSESAGRSRPYPAGTVAVVLSVEGTSDALVSRGLVMVVSRLLEGLDVEQVLAISKDHPSSGILTRLGLQRAVGPGRNDGFVGMIRTVQDHIREYHCQRGSEEDGRMQGEPVKSSLLVGRRRDSEEDGVDNKTTTITGDRRHELPSRSCRPLRRPRVALLLSGGVDSSVALHLLLRDGYDVSCYYLKIWLQDEMDHLGTCPWEDDYRTCQEVCRQAGDVPLHAVSLQNEYHARVVAHTVQQAEKGRTPNPDVLCNSRIKFGCFVDSVLNGRGNGEVARLGSGDDDPSPLRKYDYVASGHYAQIVRDGNGVAVRLHRAPDPVKDQSYFLCALRQDQLQQLLFPIGHLHKNQVRELAATFRLPNRSRPDSQGLCFLGKLKFDDFLRCYLGERPGPIVDAATGRRLGTHRGVWYHTVGQRRGIGPFLDPRATSLGPWYVVAKDPQRDVVYCSNAYDESRYEEARSRVTVEDLHWLSGTPPSVLVGNETPSRFLIKVRHGPKLAEGTLVLDPNGDASVGEVQLDKVDSGLAPGQYLVFYNGTGCLGSGVISERHWATFVGDDHHRHRQPHLAPSPQQRGTLNLATSPAEDALQSTTGAET